MFCGLYRVAAKLGSTRLPYCYRAPLDSHLSPDRLFRTLGTRSHLRLKRMLGVSLQLLLPIKAL